MHDRYKRRERLQRCKERKRKRNAGETLQTTEDRKLLMTPCILFRGIFFFLGWDDLARGAVSYINMPLQLPPLIWEDFPQDFRKQAAGISSHSDTEH